jgi:hypothetical protein
MDHLDSLPVTELKDLSISGSKQKLIAMLRSDTDLIGSDSMGSVPIGETIVVNVKVKYLRPRYQNLKEWMADPQNVYIARGGIVFIDGERFPKQASLWHNPFKVAEGRQTCLDRYREYITKKIVAENLVPELLKLKGKNLGCWCKGEGACHGDILVELIDFYSPKTS